MSSKEKKVEMEMESGAEKRKEAEEAIRTEPEPERPNGAIEPVHWLVQVKEKMGRQFNTYLAAAAVMMLLALLITAMWVVPVIAKQNKKIASIEARLERDMKTSNGKLWEEFQRMEKNHTSQISELESKLQTMQQELAIGEEKLLHAKTEISVLKERVNNENKKLLEHERKLAEVAESLREKEELLQEALARAAAFEEQHNSTVERVSILELNHLELSVDLSLTRAELNTTASVLQDTVEDLEERLRNTTARTVTLEEELDDVERDIATVNATKASREEVSQQQCNISQLTSNLTRLEGRVQEINVAVETKAAQQDFNKLSARVTSLEGSTVNKDTFQQLKSTVEDIKANKADETDLSQLKRRVDSLSTNTATKSALNDLDTKLNGHISSSVGTHRDLSSRIGSNSGSISKNRGDISLLKTQSSSAAGLAVPWMTIITSSVPLVTACWTTYTY